MNARTILLDPFSKFKAASVPASKRLHVGKLARANKGNRIENFSVRVENVSGV